MKSSKKNGMNRRTFIKAGMVGTATAMIAPPALAETLRQMAAYPLGRATYAALTQQASATACVDCEGCTARCVNGLDIAAKMDRARTVLA